MDLIITAEEFCKLRDISEKIDERKINESIKLAQLNDFQLLLGDFYFEVSRNFNDNSFDELMNGSDFTYDKLEVSHLGLKAVLADLAYSRYILKINVQLTPFGAVTKEHRDSVAVTRETLRAESKQAQIDANIKFEYVKKFINETKEAYECYKDREVKKAPYRGIRISKV